MNKFIVFLCFTVVLFLHIIIFLNYKNHLIISSKPQNNDPILLQLSHVKQIQKKVEVSESIENIISPIISKPIKPKVEKKKEIVKEKPIKKTIKREALVKKETKDIKTSQRKNKEQIKKIKKTPSNSLNNKKLKKDTDKNLEMEIQKYIDTYASKLREEINKNKNYPRISKRLQEEGIVTISFRVLNSGLFTNIKVSSSSGKKRLDKAALNALYDTKRYKAFDKDLLKKDFIDFKLPLEFKLY